MLELPDHMADLLKLAGESIERLKRGHPPRAPKPEQRKARE